MRLGALGLALALLGVPARAGADHEGDEGDAETGPVVSVFGDGVRVFRDGVRGGDRPLASSASDARTVELVALRDETVALQVVVRAGESALDHVEVRVTTAGGVSRPSAESFGSAGGAQPGTEPRDAGGAPSGAQPTDVDVDTFVEVLVPVRSRSRSERAPQESLAFAAAARPADAAILGDVADPLVPLPLPREDRAGYPLHLEPLEHGAVWVDLHVARDAVPGEKALALEVTAAGERLAVLPISLEVRRPVLPWGAARFFAYYDFETELARRVGDPVRAERSLFATLHAHHVEPLVSLRAKLDVERVRPALDGSMFARASGYRGPGEGLPVTVAALGAYGALGEPAAHKLDRVRAVSDAVPPSVLDLFLYAVDEQCASQRGPAWRSLLAGAGLERVRVAHTCSEDPRTQPVDVVMMPAQTFRRSEAREARALGKRVWVYNGRAPWTGSFALDLPVTSLRASAWIAARYDVDRWFLWETTFWNDDNAGGRGEHDPYAEAETFHNADGDAVLFDGLLLYPGTEVGTFAAASLGEARVYPSVRLKNLRRGIQDAGIYALARAARPAEADAIAAALIPRALDEVTEEEAQPFPASAAAYDDARIALLALVPDDAVLSREGAARSLFEAAASRPAPPLALVSSLRARLAAGATLLGLAAFLALGRHGRQRAA